LVVAALAATPARAETWGTTTIIDDGPGLFAQVVTGEQWVRDLAALADRNSAALWFTSSRYLAKAEAHADAAGTDWVAWDFETFPASDASYPDNLTPVASVKAVVAQAQADGYRVLLQVANNWSKTTDHPFSWRYAHHVLHAAGRADMVMVQWMSWECTDRARLAWMVDAVHSGGMAQVVVGETQLDEQGMGWGGCDIDSNLPFIHRLGAVGAWSWWTRRTETT
jgi:hypothetical protein